MGCPKPFGRFQQEEIGKFLLTIVNWIANISFSNQFLEKSQVRWSVLIIFLNCTKTVTNVHYYVSYFDNICIVLMCILNQCHQNILTDTDKGFGSSQPLLS